MRSQAAADLVSVPRVNILSVCYHPAWSSHVQTFCWSSISFRELLLVANFSPLPFSHSLWRNPAGQHREFLSPWLSQWLSLVFPLCLENLGDPRREGRWHMWTRCTLRFPYMSFACDDNIICCKKDCPADLCMPGVQEWGLSCQRWGQELVALTRGSVGIESFCTSGLSVDLWSLLSFQIHPALAVSSAIQLATC